MKLFVSHKPNPAKPLPEAPRARSKPVPAEKLEEAAEQLKAEQQAKDGSWKGGAVGNVYGTSIALTILQLPYALVPIYQR